MGCSAIRAVSNVPHRERCAILSEYRISEVVWWTGKLIRMQRVQVFSDWCQLVSHPVIRDLGSIVRLTKVKRKVLRSEN